MERNMWKDLGEVSCDDIAPKVRRKKSSSYYIFSGIRVLAFMVCFVVFMSSMANIVENFIEYDKGGDDYEEIKNNFNNKDTGSLTPQILSAEKIVPLKGFEEMLVSDGVIPPIVSDEEMEEFLIMRNKLALMSKELPGLYGWITVPGTNIDYPIMQTDNNSYYVDHTAEGKENSLGAIFVDYRCNKPTYDTQNLLIYGHNIRSWGTMFNNLTNFFTPAFFDSHKTINVWTFDGIYEYTVISVYETTIHDDYTKLNFKDDDFVKFIEQTINNSANDPGQVQYDASSRLITLTTCSNSFDKDKRYALVGIMTKSITAR